MSPTAAKKSKPVPRLYCKGRILGYKRGKRIQTPNRSLLAIENVNDLKSTEFYLGKYVAYIYRAQTPRKLSSEDAMLLNLDKKGESVKSCKRVIWGKITGSHGNSGVVKARFRSNLPPTSFGEPCRIPYLNAE